jgi:hypothetical protein
MICLSTSHGPTIFPPAPASSHDARHDRQGKQQRDDSNGLFIDGLPDDAGAFTE